MSRLVADGLAGAGVGQSRDGSFGFVFPVYGWRPPRMVARFVRDEFAARLDGIKPDYVWAVMTCGFDVGYADAVLDKMLLPVLGRGLDAAFSVRMPDTYICLPGFRLNPPDLAEEKMRAAESLIPAIAASNEISRLPMISALAALASPSNSPSALMEPKPSQVSAAMPLESA